MGVMLKLANVNSLKLCVARSQNCDAGFFEGSSAVVSNLAAAFRSADKADSGKRPARGTPSELAVFMHRIREMSDGQFQATHATVKIYNSLRGHGEIGKSPVISA